MDDSELEAQRLHDQRQRRIAFCGREKRSRSSGTHGRAALKGQLASANQIIMPDHAPQPVTQTIGEGVVCRGGMSGKLKVWFDLTAELPEPSPLQVGDKVRVIVEKVSE